ncbi:Flp family type IVb pilin [Qipengyuania sp. GH1]|uniref:Flp family type IVb pilin n=1 Tax=Qipengyuania aestuarii TaxID=2867241 RepID=UPI001C876CC2|nr:Flp family type IVb pilin [Qipengyuania aestuarii]
MVRYLKALGHDERGATAVEYGLILALIFFALVGALETFGKTTINMWNHVSSTVAEAREK